MCATGLITAGLLAGCGASQPQSAPTVGATVSVSAEPPDQATSPPTADTPTPVGGRTFGSLPPGLNLPSKPVPSAGQQVLTGQVEAGVERGCLVLQDSTGLYQLLGGDPTVVYAGAQVTVTGHVVTGVMSYCMQGRPFQIDEAQRS
jgi:hypothetical protein